MSILDIFKKKEVVTPSVVSKGLDETQLYRKGIISQELPANGKYNIVLMDDVHFMNKSLAREIERLPDALIDIQTSDKIFKNIEDRFSKGFANRVKRFAESFDINNYNILQFTGEFCGYEVIQSVTESNSNIDFAILDIILGGVVINEEDKFTIIDGIDVGKFLIDQYPPVRIMFHTGCSMNNSKEEAKMKNLIGENDNTHVTTKGLDHIERYADILIMLSGEALC
jgi:hypothetical protein